MCTQRTVSVCAGLEKKNAHGTVMTQHLSLHYSFSFWTHKKQTKQKQKLREKKAQPWLGQSLNQMIKLETTGYNQSVNQEVAADR